ncbi:MAG: hypothetical protein ACO3GB_01895 [Burkholderiaceae bacterium]
MKPLTPRAKVVTLALLVAYGTSYGQVLGGSATGENSVAIGAASTAPDGESTAIGAVSKASGRDSTALGAASKASGKKSAAFGWGSKASGSSSTAVGAASEASGRSSVALGVASKATEDDTVSVGHGDTSNTVHPATRRIVNVTAGKNATDAVNKAQLDALLTRIKALEAKLASK